jgi:diadenosine tetraphosphate (Ap4A) HIT family hydrolase
MMDCYSCAREAEFGQLPARELIAADRLWRLAHAFDVAVLGWLVLVPRRHVTAIGELTDAEASSLGSWLVRTSRSLQAVVGCEKTYVSQFAEGEGFAHVHFHVIPRPADLPSDLRGPRIFYALAAGPGERVSVEEMDEVAAQLAIELSAR